MPWNKTILSSLPGSMLSKGMQQLFDEYWGKTILTSENSHSLRPWLKPLRKWNKNYPLSMPSMPRSSKNLEKGNSPLDDHLTMG